VQIEVGTRNSPRRSRSNVPGEAARFRAERLGNFTIETLLTCSGRPVRFSRRRSFPVALSHFRSISQYGFPVGNGTPFAFKRKRRIRRFRKTTSATKPPLSPDHDTVVTDDLIARLTQRDLHRPFNYSTGLIGDFSKCKSPICHTLYVCLLTVVVVISSIKNSNKSFEYVQKYNHLDDIKSESKNQLVTQ